MIEIYSGKSISLQSGHQPRFLTGLDAGKSSTPGVGDMYYATDVKVVYACYVAGTWQLTYAITTSSNVSASRSFGVEYTNNTGRTMFIHISARYVCPAVGDEAQITLKTPGVTFANSSRFQNDGGAVDCNVSTPMLVKSGDTYRCDTFLSGTAALYLASWGEAY